MICWGGYGYKGISNVWVLDVDYYIDYCIVVVCLFGFIVKMMIVLLGRFVGVLISFILIVRGWKYIYCKLVSFVRSWGGICSVIFYCFLIINSMNNWLFF